MFSFLATCNCKPRTANGERQTKRTGSPRFFLFGKSQFDDNFFLAQNICQNGEGHGDRDHDGNTINGYGAGIGSGQDGFVYNINITGGDIEAYGGWDAAGIGTGEGNPIVRIQLIEISGGNVYARGKRYGVGIGAGEDATCGTISITGGTVHAHGDEKYCGNWTGAMGAFHEDHRDNDWQDCKLPRFGYGLIWIGKCMRLHTWTAYNGYWEHVSYTANWWDYVHGRSEVIFEECNHVDGAYDITNCPYCHSYTLQLK